MHLLHNVTPADKLSLDVNLRDSRPIGIHLNLLSEDLVFQAVDVFVLLDVVELENLDYVIGESTARHLPAALHEQANVVL